MQNVEMEVKGDKLTLTIDLSQDGTPSKSGKTMVVATTRGNVTVPGDSGVILGLNAYTKR